MTAFILEALFLIILFTAVMGGRAYKNPIGVIYDYPPAIRKRCVELGIVEEKQTVFSKGLIIKKGVAAIVMGALVAFLVLLINDAEIFIEAFGISYGLWLIVTWYDALILDCLWFCHSKRMVIPGTEGMKEYKDYLFHIKASARGSVIGLPVCALAGFLVWLFH